VACFAAFQYLEMVSVLVDVLLVEGDLEILERASALLAASGFQVTSAATLGDAMDCLRHRAFDVVISDLMMEATELVEGWRATGQLQALSPLAPFGLIAGVALSDDELARHGIAFALPRPPTSEHLLGAVAHCLALPAISAGRQATIRAYFSSLERADWDRLVALCTADVRYCVPADDVRVDDTVSGRSAFRQFAEDTFSRFVEPRFIVQRMRALPDGVLVRYEGSWRINERRSASLSGALLFRFEGTEIAEIGVRVDLRRARDLPLPQPPQLHSP